MAQKTLDQWAEEFEDLLVKTEDFEFASGKELMRLMWTMRTQVHAWQIECERGRPNRRKAERRKARAGRLSTGAEVPLWGDE